jgi:hypothetical protein
MVLIVSFVASVVGTLWFARRVAGVAGELEFSAARLPGLLLLTGIVLWLLAVWRA